MYILSKVSLPIIQFLNQIYLLESKTNLLFRVNNLPESLHLNRCLFCWIAHLIVGRLLQVGQHFF